MIKKSKTCMESEMKKLSTPAKKKKYPNPKQRVAIGLNVCGLSKYENGGLIAPNGKKSNLTPEQYKLVRTPEFKKWFGDWENDPKNASKVVDENGEPLICYHATGYDFNVFKLSEIGKSIDYGTVGAGFYFTSSYENAKNYENSLSTNNPDIKETKIIKCFLNIRKIKVENSHTKFSGFNRKESEKYTEKLKTKGFDGIIIDIYFSRKYNYKWFVAFEPNQIKLADGSNTTFDSNNPDIRFDKGGKVKTDKSGNYIGDGRYHVEYSTFDFSEYPQIDIKVNKSETTESVYVTYKNNDNGKSIILRFSTHENNAVKFGDQLNGNLASKNEVLYKLGLMNRKFIPKKRLFISWKQPKKVDLDKYEVADKTMKELYDLGENADISMYKGKLAKGSNYLITGDKIESSYETRLDSFGNEVRIGDYIYESFEKGGEIKNNNWGLNNLIYWWK